MLAFVYDVPRPPFPSFPSLSSLYPNIPLFSLLYKHFPSFYLYKRSRNHVHSLARILLCLTLVSIIPRAPKSSRLSPSRSKSHLVLLKALQRSHDHSTVVFPCPVSFYSLIVLFYSRFIGFSLLPRLIQSLVLLGTSSRDVKYLFLFPISVSLTTFPLTPQHSFCS